MRVQIKKMLQGRRMKKQGKRLAAGLLTAVMALGLVSGNGAMAYANEKQGDSPDLTDGLIGHWTFDGGSENDAWLVSEVTENLVATKTETGVSLSEDGGISGGGVDFSGTAETYLTLKLSDANVGLSAETGSFSIGAWIKYREVVLANNVNTSVFHLDGDSAGQALLAIGPSDGKNKYSTFLGGASKYCTEAIETGTWHHIMLVIDAESDTKQVHFYVNGKETGTEALGSNIIYGNGSRAGDIRVGYHRAQESAAVNGVMDEICYYDKAVSAETVQAIYDQHALPPQIDALKAELQGLLSDAAAMTGGTEASEANLTAAKEAAEALLNDADLSETPETVTLLTNAKEDLKNAIDNYQKADSGEEPDNPITVPEGLVGYWTFEGDSDADRLASKASVEDVGAVKTGDGVTVQSSGGIAGGAASFSGDNSSYLTLNLTDADKGLVASTNPFTIGAWIKYEPDMAGGEVGISVFHQDGTTTGRAILILKNSGGMQYGTYLAASNQYCDTQIEAGKWHHVMISVDGAGENRNARIYVNGVQANESNSALAQALVDGTGNIRVGAHRLNADNQAIKGVMDEIRYYDRALSAEEIKTIYDVYGEQSETENLKVELQELITQAERLSGGPVDAKENLDRIVAEAKALLDSDSVTADALTRKKAELQEAISSYEVIAPVSIAVDTTEELRSIPSAMFGINHRYHNYGYGSWDAQNDKIFDAFNILAKDAGFGSVRYPGGTVSNLFTWKDTIGPKDQRTTTIAGNNFYSNAGEAPVDPAFGVDEAMKWIYDDLGSEAIFVYGLGRGNPQDAADLVEYLNAPNDGSNPNGGTDWAAVRAENGHEEPYGVIRFELGNEFSDTGQNYWMSGISENNRGVTDLYIEGDRMTISGQTSYYQVNNRVAKKGDWRASASLSEGLQNEERYVYYLPVVQDTAEVFVAGTKWNIVDSLAGQGAKNVCTFDYETGKITFGDGQNGNIPPSGAEIRCNYKTDQAGFVSYYDAMKEVADEIGMDIEIYSGISDGRQNEFIDQMHEKGYDDKYDGVIIHPYSNGVTSYEDSLVKAKNFSNNIATYKNKMETVTNDDSKKVAVSEFGILSVSPASNYQTSLGHAIYIANHMIDCVNAGAAYQNKHCLVDTTGSSDNLGAWQQCVIQSHQTENGYEYVSTPSARLFSIFNNMTGSTEVGQTITGNAVFTGSGDSAVMNLNVYSTKDEEGNVYVMVVNNKDRDVSPVNISVDDLKLTGKEIEVWYLTSDQITDMNTLEEPDKVAVQKTTVTGSGASLAYTLQPHSIYSFKISTPPKVAVEVEAEAGGTVSGGTAKAEIGSKITVTAQPDEGYEFAGWYLGEVKISDNASYTFEVTEAVRLTAKFTEKQIPSQKVDVVVNAEAGGTASGTQSVSVGSKVTVTAQPKEGYEFAGWYLGGVKISDNASYTFEVTEAVELTAKFTEKPISSQKVNVVVNAEAGGTASGTQSVSIGSKVTVTAQPKEGYEFAGWYNGSTKVSEAASYTFTVTGAITLTARFQQQASSGENNNTFAVGKFNYQILDKAKKTVMVQSGIAKKTKNVKKLTIPATVKINGVKYKVTQIGPSAFLNYKKLTTVVIGKNVTEIGKNAFSNCSKLKSVTVKGVNLKKIRTGAFKKTAANISVKLPKSLKGKKRTTLLSSLKKAGMSKKVKIK